MCKSPLQNLLKALLPKILVSPPLITLRTLVMIIKLNSETKLLFPNSRGSFHSRLERRGCDSSDSSFINNSYPMAMLSMVCHPRIALQADGGLSPCHRKHVSIIFHRTNHRGVLFFYRRYIREESETTYHSITGTGRQQFWSDVQKLPARLDQLLYAIFLSKNNLYT